MKMILAHHRVFITGGSGFIGSHLVRRLVSEGYEVHILWRKDSTDWRLRDVEKNIVFHKLNLLEKIKIEKLLKKINPAFIIHLATYSHYRNQEDAFVIVETSVLGTLNLLLASKDIPYSLFINTGSSSEYGIQNKPMEETSKTNPLSFYAVAKLSATQLCTVFADFYKKPIVSVRPFSVYGPMEDASRFIPTIIKAVIEGKPIHLTKGALRRDFIYIDDVVDCYMRLMQKSANLKEKIYNMGTGIEYTNYRVVQTLFRIAGKKVSLKKGIFPKRIWDSPHWVADIRRTKKQLLWKPKYSLETGLAKTYEWYSKHLSKISYEL